jgi:hypothetical protein
MSTTFTKHDWDLDEGTIRKVQSSSFAIPCSIGHIPENAA